MSIPEIFIEKPKEPENYLSKGTIQDKILEKQEIVRRKHVKATRKRQTDLYENRIFERKESFISIKYIFTPKRIILLSVFFVLGLVSFLPFYINISYIYWEKNRKFFDEGDLLYRMESKQILSGLQATGNKKYNAEISYPNLPLLKIRTYTVKKGDSLYRIAKLFNVTVDTIITANGVKNGLFLNVGSSLRVPNISGIYYTVKKGDSLYSISKKYGVSISSIADINDLSSSKIFIGQKIFIPGGRLSDWDRAVALGEIFRRPARGRLSSRFGFRKDPFTGKIAFHAGIDIANRQGTPVYAAQSGKVIYAGYYGSYGKTVIIQHPNGYKTLYAHLYRIYTRRGRYVKQGQKIALMGNTGRSTGPHLHFEVHQGRKIINPLKLTKLR